MIALTFDTDWAPEPVIDDLLALLDEAGLPATIFATHESAALTRAHPRYEIGLHPNFLPGPPYEPALDRIQSLYPEARGVRSHGLVQSSFLSELFAARGLRFESNIIAFERYEVQPFPLHTGLWSVPIHWGDYTGVRTGRWPAPGRFGRDKSLAVLNLHPVHVFLDTESEDHYRAAKPFLQDPDRLLSYRSTGSKRGVRAFLLQLLDTLSGSGAEVVTLSDAVERLSSSVRR